MSEEKVLTPKELKAQADAILAAADGKKAAKAPTARKSGKAAKSTAVQQEPPQLMTDEEAKKAGILRLDDKQVAALPAASWLAGQEKLRELLAQGKKKGRLDSSELMEAVRAMLPIPPTKELTACLHRLYAFTPRWGTYRAALVQ